MSADSFHMGGRGDRTRTCDSLVPNQERYQLRYTSVLKAGAKVLIIIDNGKWMMDNYLEVHIF